MAREIYLDAGALSDFWQLGFRGLPTEGVTYVIPDVVIAELPVLLQNSFESWIDRSGAEL